MMSVARARFVSTAAALASAAALAALGAGFAARPAFASEEYCLLHRNEMHAPIVHLTPAAVDSIGFEIAGENLALIEAIDAAYREGKYGKPGEKSSKEGAVTAFIYNAKTAFDLVTSLALQSDVIYETSEEDLREAFTSKFRNPGFYPVVDLAAARTGFGRYCLTFHVDRPKKEIVIAGDAMTGWSEEIDLGGKRTRVLNIDMKTFSYDRVHVVYERHSEGAILAFDATVGGAPVSVVAMEGILGQYIRKYGFHDVNALAMWKTRVEPLGCPAKGQAALGAAIYFPSLKVETPWFLPDLGFDDLRKFEYPEPLLTMESVQALQERKLEWLKIKKNLRFANWEGDGGIPDDLKARFPDQ